MQLLKKGAAEPSKECIVQTIKCVELLVYNAGKARKGYNPDVVKKQIYVFYMLLPLGDIQGNFMNFKSRAVCTV